jgi:hypothetical protein
MFYGLWVGWSAHRDFLRLAREDAVYWKERYSELREYVINLEVKRFVDRVTDREDADWWKDAE